MSDEKDSSQTALRLVPKEPVPEILIHRFGEMELRCVVRDGEPWFFAVDVCQALGLENVTRALESLKSSTKSALTHPSAIASFRIVSEPGLYKLIFKSKKAEAEAFQEWVVTEVLPAIRATGSYQTAKQVPQNFKESIAFISVIHGKLLEAADRIEVLETKVLEQAPKAAFADMVGESKPLHAIRHAGNKFVIPQNEFIELLAEWDMIYRTHRWHGKAWTIQQDLLRDVISDTGHPQTKVTGKGLAYIGARLDKEGLMPWPKKKK